jgi:hypothetical protein
MFFFNIFARLFYTKEEVERMDKMEPVQSPRKKKRQNKRRRRK